MAKVLRGMGVAVALAILLTGCLSVPRLDAFSLLNRDRTSYGLPPLRSHGQLQSKAQAWAARLARENRLYHSNLTDGVPSCWTGLGENVGYGSSVAQVEAAYMNSPAHRANILNSRFNWVGVGVAWNNGRVYVVQEFMDGC